MQVGGAAAGDPEWGTRTWPGAALFLSFTHTHTHLYTLGVTRRHVCQHNHPVQQEEPDPKLAQRVSTKRAKVLTPRDRMPS